MIGGGYQNVSEEPLGFLNEKAVLGLRWSCLRKRYLWNLDRLQNSDGI